MAKVINTFINKLNSQLSQQTEPLALYHTKTFETSKYSRDEVQFIRGESSLTRIWTRSLTVTLTVTDTKNRVRLCFKIHALSNSRVAVLETNFFAHGNCCQLLQRTFLIFFSVKLETYPAAAKLMTDHWCLTNNIVSCYSVLVSSTQRNIVLPFKLRIPESKLIAFVYYLFSWKFPLCVVTVIQNQLFKTTPLVGAGSAILSPSSPQKD